MLASVARADAWQAQAVYAGALDLPYCALVSASSELFCNGMNEYAVNFTGQTASQATIGDGFGCFLRSDHSVTCMGTNVDGELGVESNVSYSTDLSLRLLFPAGLVVQSVSAGANFACALFTAGSVRCWGLALNGALGQGNTTNIGRAAGSMTSLPAIQLGSGRTAAELFAGPGHACAILDDQLRLRLSGGKADAPNFAKVAQVLGPQQ